MSKKSIIAFITVIVLLFAAGISVGMFLYSRSTTQATDEDQKLDQTQVDNENQIDENTDNAVTNPANGNENSTIPVDEESNVTKNDNIIVTEGENANVNNNATNNNVANNNTASNTENTGNNQNSGSILNNSIGETTITRVEEQEKLISKDFWDWWKPTEVSVMPTNIGIEIPQISVKKTAITGYGGDYLVERNHDITYVIAVTNNESKSVENIEITDKIPEKTTYIENSIEDAYILKEDDERVNIETKKSIVEKNNSVIGVKWIVTIPAKETVFVSFKVRVKETILNDNNEEVETTGSIYNKAIANGKESNEVVTSIIGIDVIKTATAVKRAGETEFTMPVAEVREGDIIEYTIIVTNTGSRDLTNVLLEEKLIDVEITKLEIDGNSKDILINEDGKLIIGELKAAREATEETEKVEAGVAIIKATYEVTYEVDIKGKGNEDGSIIPIYNKVYATGESIPDPKNPGEKSEKVEDNDDEIVPVAEDPRFEITKTATRVNRAGTEKDKYIEPIGKVRPGDVVEYEIVITNTGNTTLKNIIVTDTLSVKVDSYNGTLQEVDPEKGVSELKVIPSLASGKSETIKTYYTVKTTDVTLEEKPIYNVATAQPDGCDKKADDESVPVNPNVNIEGTKTWYAPDGYELPTIEIKLYQNGEPFKLGDKQLTYKISKGNNYYQFLDLPKYKFVNGIYELDKDKNYIINEYTVEETQVKGFTSSKDPKNEYNFINTIEQEFISIKGTKYWDDNNNQDGKRTDIKIRLWADGIELTDKVPVISKEQDAEGKWTYEFKKLNKYSSTGKVIEYTVTEDTVSGYEKPVIEKYDITNKRTPEKITVSGTKTWIGDNGKIRPTSITVKLLKDGKDTGKTVEVTENTNWSYSFSELDRYENGKEIKYTVQEDTITNYVPTYSNPTGPVNGVVTVNIVNTWRQDIQGTIINVQESEVPLDVVFVLDISSSMLEKDGGSKTRAQYMVEATNDAIKELMKYQNNRVAVVLFNSNVSELTRQHQLSHYNADKNGNYITYSEEGKDNLVGAKISFTGMPSSVNIVTSNDWYNCGTYTQGGVKTATSIFKNTNNGTTVTDSNGKTVIRKPVMIVLTDGDPTHYDTETAYNKYGSTKYPTWNIAKLRYITAEYYAYTMKTMQNCKKTIQEYYNKECELYTVGINMKGTMAKTLLEPTTANINHLSDTTNEEVSPDIHNHDDNGNKDAQHSHIDEDGKWRKNEEYYKYQANKLETLLGENDTKITSGYVNKAYTTSSSGDIANNFKNIIKLITEVKIVITDELYGSDRKIELDGFNPNSIYNQPGNAKNIYSLKIKQNGNKIVDTIDITDANSTKYIKKDSITNKYYLIFTDVLGTIDVELKYHK